MPRKTVLLTDLRQSLDGQPVDRAFARDCPSCGQAYATGDRLVVAAERPLGADTWETAVVCAECDAREVETPEPALDQALVSIAVVATPVTRVLDGEQLELLDYAPATEPAD